ncbi:DUF983 domain-containing protein [Rhizobium sp. RM]|uniref:DUF983 domain-containing protein n=1 Tax=Rhizobium sp. RM TaxID=2748079 RepID=UPI00110F25D1|nr:DUF983 domain-containing protein [Rhizobium sp. RM]NWJ27634.1 DUF983 domain-containing protein [Rhizobium sp. RM]TMV18905.1 DUF983 domain-containing protein [Rhizobium sp. Td3]
MADDWPQLPPVKTGLKGLCPRCGRGHLFDGYLSVKKECEVCGLDFSFADPADGPAFFVLCFTSIPAVAVACYIEVSFSPVWWVHLFTSLPLVLLSCLVPLRLLKGWLINSQYFYKAEEGKIDREFGKTSSSSLETDRN